MGFENQACAHSTAVLLSQSQQSQQLLLLAFDAQQVELALLASIQDIKAEEAFHPDIILVDTLQADLEDQFALVAQCAKKFAKAHIVCLFNNPSMSDKIGALTHGAHATWDMAMGKTELSHHIHLALSSTQPRQTAARDAHQAGLAKIDTSFEGFVGQSVVMQSLYAQIGSMAPSNAPVFITGESGAGKEVCAQALHQRSKRAGGTFVALNCGAIPADLMESEIFGAVAGAYTGATKDRIGSAELADGGTLFLDEIGEMELGLQAKLLRFLQTGTINRVGDPNPIKLDVRIICATNKSPQNLVSQGKFRQDLFYRLHVLPLNVPSLRERRQDIGNLAQHFLAIFNAQENKAFGAISADCLQSLSQYDWPGNVRQLQNMIRRAVILHHGTTLEAAMLDFDCTDAPTEMTAPAAIEPMPTPVANGAITPLWQQEQAIIDQAIAACDGNIAKAAKALEISPSTIYRKIESWRGKAA